MEYDGDHSVVHRCSFSCCNLDQDDSLERDDERVDRNDMKHTKGRNGLLLCWGDRVCGDKILGKN